jgi:hypothetical protein
MTPKEKQRELIVEIMKADEQSGLYPAMKQTAVKWFALKVMYLKMNPKEIRDFIDWYEEALEMEKEQIKDAYKVIDLDIQHEDVGEINSEEYYKETYE